MENEVLLDSEVDDSTPAKRNSSAQPSSDIDLDHVAASHDPVESLKQRSDDDEPLDFAGTVKLSLEFCLIWFVVSTHPEIVALTEQYSSSARRTILQPRA